MTNDTRKDAIMRYMQAIENGWKRYENQCLDPSIEIFGADLERAAVIRFEPPYRGREFAGHVYDVFVERLDEAIRLQQNYANGSEWRAASSGAVTMAYPDHNMALEICGRLSKLMSALLLRDSVVDCDDVGHIYFLNGSVHNQLAGVKGLRDQLMGAYQQSVNSAQEGEI